MVPLLVCVDRVVDRLVFNNLIEILMIELLKGVGLTKKELSQILLCLGTNGVNVFQKGKIIATNKSRIHGHHFLWVFIMLFIEQHLAI